MKKFIIEAKDMNEHTYQIDEYDTKQQAIGGLKLERAWLAASDMIKITDLGENKFRADNAKYGDWAEYYIKEK